MDGYYCWDAYYTQLAIGYEAGFGTGERRPCEEWHIPLRWVTAWVGAVSLIGFGLGLTLKWLLQ